jgi:hypothetical protein
MELQFEDNEYYLVDENNDTIATTDKILLKEYDGYMKKLSKQNCDEIFGVVHVEKLADENYPSCDVWTKEQSLVRKLAFKNGFNKAMELNKDKLFTVEDIMKAFEAGYETLESEKTYNEHYDILIQSLQQTEWDVEIEMEQLMTFASMSKEGEKRLSEKPKLDENGCLILTKKKS